MKWNHLPESGGLNRQHPTLMERFRTVHQVRSAYEEREQAKKDKASMGPTPKNPPGR